MKRWVAGALVACTVGLVPSLAGAVEPQPKVSQREWMRANGADKGAWMVRHLDCTKVGTDPCGAGTGEYLPEPTKALTRATMVPVDASGNLTSGYKAGNDCQSACHSIPVDAGRISRDVDGFTNAFDATAQYSGVIDPGMLLTSEENTTAHAVAFRAETVLDADKKVVGRPGGCAACHSPEAAAFFGVEKVVGCKSCHNYNLMDPMANVEKGLNLHLTHATLLQVEKPIGDVDSPPEALSCDYCHKPTAEGGTASCWNCHLSGHWPQVPYWSPFAGSPVALP